MTHSQSVLPLAFVLGGCLILGCGSRDSESPPVVSIQPQESASEQFVSVTESAAVELVADRASAFSPASARDPFPEVTVATSLGSIRVKLNAESAPLTVQNFLENYVDRGFYDQTIFHYVQSGFIVLGGGYTADRQPKPIYSAINNESKNGLLNKRGTIAMMRHGDHEHSATSQFFFNLVDNPQLDPQGDGETTHGYCVFGEVIEGMEVLDRIAQVPVSNVGDFVNLPTTPVTIESVQRAD